MSFHQCYTVLFAMNVLQGFLLAFCLPAFAYLAFNVIYQFIFALAGRLKRPEQVTPSSLFGNTRFAVLIPAYKEDSVIVQTAEKALQQDYPSGAFDVFVIADSLQPETLRKLALLPIRVITVTFEKSTKAKSLNVALAQLSETDYDATLVLDADNLLDEGALAELDCWMRAGYKAVQGHRTAKNKDTAIAFLDAISEELSNHIFRRGHRALGLSSALIGSGAAIEFNLFKRLMKQIEAVGGFDKELEYRLFAERVTIAYAEDALILDEKVRKPEVFYNQRRRWMAAQWRYSINQLGTGLRELSRGNIDYFDKVCQTLLMPRLLLLGVLTLVAAASLALNLPFGSATWLGLWAGLVLTLALSFPKQYFTRQLLRSVLQLPHLFWLMVRLLFNLKGANQRFIHTPHEH